MPRPAGARPGLVVKALNAGFDATYLHASVADARGQMHGGHVMACCIVRTAAEIVLALLLGWAFGRA
ncbi:DNA-binding protein [Polaromonas sp. P2-4]|nr:DNA-binding protein [Polaromonas sp. P2-4]